VKHQRWNPEATLARISGFFHKNHLLWDNSSPQCNRNSPFRLSSGKQPKSWIPRLWESLFGQI